MGSLYNKTRDPNQVKSMGFKEMRYWVTWNEAIDKGLKEAMESAKS